MIAALFGVGIVTGGDDEPDGPTAAELQVERVARAVERVRGLRFDELPPVRTVTPAQAREEGLATVDEEYPPERRRADQALLAMLGLLPPGSDLRELLGTVFGEEVAGYYDQRKKQMTIVTEDGEEGDDAVLAHELTHALEDQHFDIEVEVAATDDELTARTALLEGTATVAMFDYIGGGDARRRDALRLLRLGDLLVSENLPPYLQHSLLFPYAAGARFVDAIGTWGPANRALRSDSPLSTEQVLHPRKYRAGELPLPVRLPRPGGGWRRAAGGTIGEFDTAELVRTSDTLPRARAAAAGWGGGSYALWRRGRDYALALGWRWDTTRDAAEFTAALPRYITRTLRGRTAGPGLWRIARDRFAAVAAGPVVRLALAPSRELARRLAAAPGRPR